MEAAVMMSLGAAEGKRARVDSSTCSDTSDRPSALCLSGRRDRMMGYADLRAGGWYVLVSSAEIQAFQVPTSRSGTLMLYEWSGGEWAGRNLGIAQQP